VTPLGIVSLVGAGPGDPELLTVRAVRRLQEAEVVLHDALVPQRVVDLAITAKRLGVGKRAGQPSCPEEEIVRLMIRAARRGRRVVRLKCGDPFVLGRGGEEALALTHAGIPYEVVPGLSTALAAPAAAGIPVTHRGLSAAFVVVSGHAPAAYAPVLDTLAPASATVVILMGLRTAGDIAVRLMAHGWPRATPAAVILGAWTEDEAVWAGALADLGDYRPTPQQAHLPGTIVIGATAAFACATGQGALLAGMTRGGGRTCARV
jgi:uroporphyrin-III C-methyltransferase/precorrin-2 dehydrogenase/sirohydrochlorin ferrochelatase